MTEHRQDSQLSEAAWTALHKVISEHKGGEAVSMAKLAEALGDEYETFLAEYQADGGTTHRPSRLRAAWWRARHKLGLCDC